MTVFEGDGFSIYVENMTEEVERFELYMELVNSRIVVYGEEREEFLEPIVRELKEKKELYKMKGPRQVSQLLYLIADFRDKNNPEKSISRETLETIILRMLERMREED